MFAPLSRMLRGADAFGIAFNIAYAIFSFLFIGGVLVIGDAVIYVALPLRLTLAAVVFAALAFAYERLVALKLRWDERKRLPTNAIPINQAVFDENCIGSLKFYEAILPIKTYAKPPGDGRTEVSVPDAQDISGADLVEVGLDPSRTAFFWRWSAGPGVDRRMTLRPWEMSSSLAPGFHLSPEAWKKFENTANFVWTLMRDSLDGAIKDDRLEIWAKSGSAMNNFQRIALHEWAQYDVVDWEKGNATSGTGEHLLSVHVKPKE